MNLNEIQEKDRKLNEVKEQLKREFFGIDAVIDGVMENFRSWYLFPNSIRKPIVINLWGMTGCGKTSLVRRLCELLDIGGNMMYYNLAKLDEDSSSDMEDNIRDNISAKVKNPVFVLDEFQYAATIDSKGNEKDNKTALKTIWELIDTGKLYSKLPKYTLNNIVRIELMASVLSNTKIDVVDGKLTNLGEIFDDNKMSSYYYTMSKYFNCNYDKWEPNNEEAWSEMLDEYIDNDPNLWISAFSVATIYDTCKSVVDDSITVDDIKKKVMSMNIDKFYAFMQELDDQSKKGYYKDYSKSLIFVIGNIDEAYDISYDMNPDMDADLFNEITRKLTIVDIKNALQRRFRNEQIARLGNIMYLYPSFSVDDFRKIIKYYLQITFDHANIDFGIKVSADSSVSDIVYNESVFPTQGTRPIISGIYEMVESKISTFVVMSIDKHKQKPTEMKLSFRDGKVVADVTFGDGQTDTFEIEHQLRVDNKRQNRQNETQAITAVHESGHFVMYAKLFGKMPKKLVSNCVSSTASGFMMPPIDDDDFISREDYYKHIQVDLAGYAAEKAIFGIDNITSGASSDIDKATMTASKMVRRFGMNPSFAPAVYTYLVDNMGTSCGLEVNCDNETISMAIKTIILTCLHNIEETFKDADWKAMLAESSSYMFENTSMNNDKMLEIYNKVPKEKREESIRSEQFYRDKLTKLSGN